MEKIKMQERQVCFFCGSNNWLETHHIFGGANRKKSEKYGLVVDLCHFCHNEPPLGVHHNAKQMLKLKQAGQKAFEQVYGHEKFMQEFGKNYREVENDNC